MNIFLERLGSSLARYLTRPRRHYERFSALSQVELLMHLQPGDLLLVEGNSRISTAIKYLTQSTWSHIALYTGDATLVEADLVKGVVPVPIVKYVGYNLRICRPVNLSEKDRAAVVDYVVKRIGYRYDTRNVLDLMRYLLPTPPVPTRFRRKLIAFGSGEPTRAICSTLVAQAFQSIRYPILPRGASECEGAAPTPCDDAVLESRHFSHFTPRDFDLSPYFEIVKPAVRANFDYHRIRWADTAGQGADA